MSEAYSTVVYSSVCVRQPTLFVSPFFFFSSICTHYFASVSKKTKQKAHIEKQCSFQSLKRKKKKSRLFLFFPEKTQIRDMYGLIPKSCAYDWLLTGVLHCDWSGIVTKAGVGVLGHSEENVQWSILGAGVCVFFFCQQQASSRSGCKTSSWL